jgi:hypothetical protein
MKKIAFILLTSLFLCIQNGFAQIKPGTYYTTFGLLGKVTEVRIEETPSKKLRISFETEAFVVTSLGDNIYQADNNTCRVLLREDGDIELFTIRNLNNTNYFNTPYLITAKKEEAKERWKKAKSAMVKQAGEKVRSLSAYFYKVRQGERTDDNEGEIEVRGGYQGGDVVELNVNGYGFNKFTKIGENTYVYGMEYSGSATTQFIRFFPAEKKIIAYDDPHKDQPRLTIAQQKSVPEKTEADEKKAQELIAFVQTYMGKQKVNYINKLTNNTSADLSVAKITAVTKEYFGDNYTVTKVKLLTKNWELERNEFDRVLRRLHTIVAYLKNNKTGKCYFAFRYIGQEFDGSSYGESDVYTSNTVYYIIKNDKEQPLLISYLNGEYEIPCAEISK